MSAVFSGPSRDLGQNMKLGVETSFQTANEAGGVHGRTLTLTALDDGYEATRVAVTMKELIEDRGVFAVVGNVGTGANLGSRPYYNAEHVPQVFIATGGPMFGAKSEVEKNPWTMAAWLA